ncbi:MAG: hypothetical protein KDC54_07590 [Lewinella sp.]|nr:hypothetical protein [Lewinella sp.]
MAPRKKKPSTRELIDQYTDLSVRVDAYDVSANASINNNIRSPESALYRDDEEPVYEFSTHLEISGTSIGPASRAGDTYDLSLYSENRPARGVNLPLKALQELDEHDSPVYRTYRGAPVPVYREPPGIALIKKDRGKPRWTVWVPALPHFVSDVLVLLGQDRQVYITLYERKVERRRWLQYLTFQTNNPLDEE